MRVLVAMSGGVDSSVVAGLLHEQGHEVVGATLQLYDHGAATAKRGACCAGQDIHDARRVADRLGVRLPAGQRDYTTVSGLVLAELERIPIVGDTARWNGLEIEVVDMDGRRIDRLLVRKS